jgi:hypothetical protein
MRMFSFCAETAKGRHNSTAVPAKAFQLRLMAARQFALMYTSKSF